jgi:hypothetical protein
MAKPVYEIAPGRTIVRDGVPLMNLIRWHRPAEEGGGYSLSPTEADQLATRIVGLLNAWASDPVR